MMTMQELSQKLCKEYNAADSGEKTTAIVLFAIRYAGELRHVSIAALVRESGIRKNYVPMVNLGRNLARHVDLKD